MYLSLFSLYNLAWSIHTTGLAKNVKYHGEVSNKKSYIRGVGCQEEKHIIGMKKQHNIFSVDEKYLQ